MRNRAALLARLITGVVIAGCGNAVGPSNDKIRLDFEDLIKEKSRGLLLISDLKMKRKTLAEDRVQVQMTASFKMNQEEVQKASNAVQTLRTSPFGGIGAFELGNAVQKARQLDGKTEEFTWVYRLEGNGLWKVTQAYNGHERR